MLKQVLSELFFYEFENMVNISWKYSYEVTAAKPTNLIFFNSSVVEAIFGAFSAV